MRYLVANIKPGLAWFPFNTPHSPYVAVVKPLYMPMEEEAMFLQVILVLRKAIIRIAHLTPHARLRAFPIYGCFKLKSTLSRLRREFLNGTFPFARGWRVMRRGADETEQIPLNPDTSK